MIKLITYIALAVLTVVECNRGDVAMTLTAVIPFVLISMDECIPQLKKPSGRHR